MNVLFSLITGEKVIINEQLSKKNLVAFIKYLWLNLQHCFMILQIGNFTNLF